MESQGTNMRRVRESEIEEKKSQLDKLHEDMEAKKLVKEDAESAEKAALGKYTFKINVTIIKLKRFWFHEFSFFRRDPRRGRKRKSYP